MEGQWLRGQLMTNLYRQASQCVTLTFWRKASFGLFCVLLSGWVLLEIATKIIPLPRGIEQSPKSSLLISDRKGSPLRMVRGEAELFLNPITFEESGATFINATLAAEDKRFWQHHGVDWLGLLRVVKEIAQHGRVMSGGSTITQQLIKNSETSKRPRNVKTKFIEILQARKLERKWTKKQIITAYLNRIDYGNLCRGAGTASWFYFDKTLASLSPAQAALLAGLPNAPSRLNPHLHIERALMRQKKILNHMSINGWLQSDQLNRAIDEPVRLYKPGRAFAAPHFIDMVCGNRDITENVKSTLDLSLNDVSRQILCDHLSRLKSQRVFNGSLVVIDNETANVIALVGSRDYFEPQSGQVNGAISPRSAGSAFKPFTYLLALEKGMTPATVLADVPTEFATDTGLFSPVNYDRRYRGPISFRDSLANSLNVPAVRVLDYVGGASVLQESLRRMGLSTLEEASGYYGLGLTIGNAEARLLELTNAYATLARLGEHRPVRLLETDPVGSKRVFNREAAWLIADILSDNDARASAFGWMSALSFPFPVACKTGTSSDFRDNWAFGYTPEFTVGVWVGNFDGAPMKQVSGLTGAAPIMQSVMMYLHKQYGTSWYKLLCKIESAKVDQYSGMRTPQGKLEYFVRGAAPEVEPISARDALGRVFLGSKFANWWRSPMNHLRDRTSLSAVESESIAILSPRPGTVVYLDPDLPSSSMSLPLLATAENAIWRSDTLDCFRSEHGGFMALLTPGRHKLQMSVGGRQFGTWIDVEEQ